MGAVLLILATVIVFVQSKLRKRILSLASLFPLVPNWINRTAAISTVCSLQCSKFNLNLSGMHFGERLILRNSRYLRDDCKVYQSQKDYPSSPLNLSYPQFKAWLHKSDLSNIRSEPSRGESFISFHKKENLHPGYPSRFLLHSQMF